MIGQTMPPWTRVLAVFLLIRLIPSCKDRYSGPVHVSPSGTIQIPFGGFVVVDAEVSSGGSPAPIVLDDFTLRCSNPAVCTTSIYHGIRGAEGRVVALEPGTSEVVITFVHPRSKEPGERRFSVTFVDGLVRTLAVSSPVPDPEHELVLLADVPGRSTLVCASYLASGGYVWKSLEGGDVHLFACEPATDVGGRPAYYFQAAHRNRWNFSPGDIEACVVSGAGKVRSISIMQRTGNTVRLIERRGPEDPERCRVSMSDTGT